MNNSSSLGSALSAASAAGFTGEIVGIFSKVGCDISGSFCRGRSKGFEKLGVFNFCGEISSRENSGNYIWLGFSKDFLDVRGERGRGSLLNFGKLVIALDLSGDSG